MDLIRPLEILVCWQALLVAMVCAGWTRIIKASVDLRLGKKWRTANPWFGELVLPIIAVTAGALFAVFVPIRAELLDNYIEHKLPDATWGMKALAYALWGGVCGQFSSYVYDRVVGLMRAFSKGDKGGSGDSTPPPVVSLNPPPGKPVAEVKDPNE